MEFTLAVGCLSLGAALFLLKFYIKWNTPCCKCPSDLTGKTALITGGSTGIGYETALGLAKRNARVILACRNMEQASKSCKQMQYESGNTDIIVKQVDMSLMKSVRQFAEKILQEEKRLDILINNAAVIGFPNRVLTEEGLELTFATNYFGHFLLTNLLLDLLKQSTPSRIITLSSLAHKMTGGLELDNLNSEKHYPRATIYADTKLANVYLTKELSRRLDGTGVTANCVHPGSCYTNLFNDLMFPVNYLLKLIAWAFFKTARDGAQTSLHCAVSSDVAGISGRYFDSCRLGEESKQSMDVGIAKKLWEKTERITGLVKS